MQSTADILAALGGLQAVARMTGTRPRTVEQWSRNGVPLKHWDLLVATARQRGIRWLTHEVLYETRAPRHAA